MSNVTFEPGCRNNWHIHHARNGGGQMLICTAGEGWYQEAGKAAQSLAPRRGGLHPRRRSSTGTARRRTAGSAHIAFDLPGEDASNEWLEPVTDEEYDRL